MARPKKIDDIQLIEGTKKYFSEVCNGNHRMLKHKPIALYLTELYGIRIEDYDLKKSKVFRGYIKSLKALPEIEHLSNNLYFKKLDVNEFLRVNNTKSLLKTALVTLDAFYEKVHTGAGTVFEDNKRLIEDITRLRKENSKLTTKNVELTQNSEEVSQMLENVRKKCREQDKRIKTLLNIINTYVYPEIANELLAESGLIKNNSQTISGEVKKYIMDDLDSISPFIKDYPADTTEKEALKDKIKVLCDELNNI